MRRLRTILQDERPTDSHCLYLNPKDRTIKALVNGEWVDFGGSGGTQLAPGTSVDLTEVNKKLSDFEGLFADIYQKLDGVEDIIDEILK